MVNELKNLCKTDLVNSELLWQIPLSHRCFSPLFSKPSMVGPPIIVKIFNRKLKLLTEKWQNYRDSFKVKICQRTL